MLEVVAFEPDSQECAALNLERYPYTIEFLPVALGAQDGLQATLFMCRQPGCSSLLQPNMELCGTYPYGKEMEVVGKHPIKPWGRTYTTYCFYSNLHQEYAISIA